MCFNLIPWRANTAWHIDAFYADRRQTLMRFEYSQHYVPDVIFSSLCTLILTVHIFPGESDTVVVMLYRNEMSCPRSHAINGRARILNPDRSTLQDLQNPSHFMAPHQSKECSSDLARVSESLSQCCR